MTSHPRSLPRARRGPVTGVVVLAAMLATACGTSGGAAGATDPPPPPATTASGPTAEPSPSAVATPSDAPTTDEGAATGDGAFATATTSTLFDTQRTFRLELHGDGTARAVTGLVLDSPWYAPLDPTPRAFTLASGLLLVPLPYGAADCRHGSPEPGADVGEVVLDTDAGPRRLPVRPHPDNLVALRHRRECAIAAVDAAADLAFGDDWTPVAPRVVTGDLLVSVDAGRTIEVGDVEGNFVFTVTAQQSLPLVVDGGSGRLAVRVSAARCDTHVLIEAKRKLYFPVAVSLDGADPVLVDVRATGPAGAVFQALLESCLDEPS